MPRTREEIQAELAVLDLEEALVAAKDAYRDKPTDKNRDARDAAIAAIQAHRAERRVDRDPVVVTEED